MEINHRTHAMTMTRGDSASFFVTCKKDSENYLEPGDTLYFTVKRRPTDAEPLIQKTVQSFVGEKAGVYIDPEDTKSMAFGDYCYDIQLTKAGGEVTTIVKYSVFKITPEVTHE